MMQTYHDHERQDGLARIPMSEAATVQAIGDLRIDFGGYRLWKQDQPIELTEREWKLLRVLVRNQGRTIESEALIQLVWGEAYRGEQHLLREYIRRLRRKLGDNPKAPRYVWNAPHLGYRFEVVSDRGVGAPSGPGGA